MLPLAPDVLETLHTQLQSELYRDKLAALKYIRENGLTDERLTAALRQFAEHEEDRYLQRSARKILSDPDPVKPADSDLKAKERAWQSSTWRWLGLGVIGAFELAFGLLAIFGVSGFAAKAAEVSLMLAGGAIFLGLAYWARRRPQNAWYAALLVYIVQSAAAAFFTGEVEKGVFFSMVAFLLLVFAGAMAIRRRTR